MNDDEASSADERPASFIRSTKLPLKRYVVIWTRETAGRQFVDPIWHVDATDEHAAMLIAWKTGRPPEELSVEEEPE